MKSRDPRVPVLIRSVQVRVTTGDHRAHATRGVYLPPLSKRETEAIGMTVRSRYELVPQKR